MSEEQLPQETPQESQQPQQSQPTNTGFPPYADGFPPNGGTGFPGMQQTLPNATVVLVLGILSIVTCCCYGVIGLILGIIALVLAKKDRALYAMNMAAYTESSFKNLNAGRVCAIIGLILNIIYLVISIALVMMFGWATLNDQEAMREILQNI